MFHFSGFAFRDIAEYLTSLQDGFPHSEILGSKVAKHLPGAYRSHATSFIASISQGIYHLPLKFFQYYYSVIKQNKKYEDFNPLFLAKPFISGER
jgi:hypothetical protein